ncbi:heparinase II/III family protein [Rheinheimera baltica]|uniref:heparinase II/III domain-containing protein n=1 Tax=Rheinheimera baltica TaxID=67576 RepID=UPI00273D2E16|nr:heparinase II/III family protein [Rheinheimera baltica]MDP5143056.1 heparinase II/III family protein [Rheinheimera baltica]
MSGRQDGYFQQKYSIVISGNVEKLMKEGFIARTGAEPVAIQLPMAWQHHDRNIAFNLHAWRFLNPVWQALFDTADSEYFSLALKFMQDWYEHEQQREHSHFCWYDMSTGIRAMHLALAIEYVNEHRLEISNAEAVLLRSLADRHYHKLHDATFITKGNHAIYQIIGLRLLSTSSDYECIDFCTQQLTKLIDEAFDENAVCTENSPFYHHYHISIFSHIQPSLFASLADKLKHTLDKAKTNSAWFTSPVGSYYQIGDTEGRGSLLRPNAFTSEKLTKHFVVKDLASSGYQIVRDVTLKEGFALIFYAANQSYNHSHSDHLSFILYFKGIELFSDSGKFSYEKDAWRDYFISDAAHNTVGLLGRRFMPLDIKLGQAELFPIRINADKIMLRGLVKRGPLWHQRSVTLRERQLHISDDVENLSDNLIELRWHLAEGVSLEQTGEFCFELIHEQKALARLRLQACISASIVCGQVTPEIQGWISRSYHQKCAAITLVVHYPANETLIQTTVELLN